MNLKKVAAVVAVTAGLVAGAGAQTLKGIETADLDRSVKPCDNFFDFSNGTWRKQNPIPASMDRWSRRWKAGEDNKDQLRVILDEVSAKTDQTAGSPAQLTGDFYAACTNVKAIDAAGMTPLKPYLDGVDGIHDAAGLQKEIRDLSLIGVMVPFTFSGSQNMHAPTDVIADVGAGGLGLPDRDYYVKTEKRFADARAGYLIYIAKIFTLSGSSEADAKAAAQTVMTMETALAKASLDNVALRDPHSVDHIAKLEDLQKMTPHFDWAAYLSNAGIAQGVMNVDEPEFMAEVEKQFTSTPIEQWKTYLRWQLLNALADNLSQPFRMRISTSTRNSWQAWAS